MAAISQKQNLTVNTGRGCPDLWIQPPTAISNIIVQVQLPEEMTTRCEFILTYFNLHGDRREITYSNFYPSPTVKMLLAEKNEETDEIICEFIMLGYKEKPLVEGKTNGQLTFIFEAFHITDKERTAYEQNNPLR